MGVNGTEHVQKLCHAANLNCVHLNHYQKGDEVYTLQALYEYCYRQHICQTATLYHRVAYLHNKGSFHSTPENAKLRIPLTQSVNSASCWNESSQSNLQFVWTCLFGFAVHDVSWQLFCQSV
jgi:hypothetical protein